MESVRTDGSIFTFSHIQQYMLGEEPVSHAPSAADISIYLMYSHDVVLNKRGIQNQEI